MKIDFKNKKTKLILIGVGISLGIIALGVGLGVGLGDVSDSSVPLTKITDTAIIPLSKITDTATIPLTKIKEGEKVEGTYWEISNEPDPLDSTKQLKTLRIKKEVTTEAQLDEAYTDISSYTDSLGKKIDLTYFNELLLPYHLQGIADIKKTAKAKLHLDNVVENQIGYVFNKSDYVATTIYKEKNIVELNLPETITETIKDQFRNNRIRKVNWEELTKLKKIGNATFFDNYLNGDLDLSASKESFYIDVYAFAANNITGTLTLPPNITVIEAYSFNYVFSNTPRYNKISGTLTLPKSLMFISVGAFRNNNIEVLDWSNAEALNWIYGEAFSGNKLKTLDFSEGVLPNILIIRGNAFKDNPGLNANGEMLIEDFTLPPSLTDLGKDAIKVKAGITVTVSPKFKIVQGAFGNSVNIFKASFE